MFTVVITEKGGEQRRLDFDKPEVTIGRVQGNDIILPKGNVSKRHSRVVLKDGKFIIVDLKSTNGTYVNGRKITSPLVIKNTDKIYIGDFILHVEDGGGAEHGAQAPAPPPSKSATKPPGPPPSDSMRRPPPPLPKRKPSRPMPPVPSHPSMADEDPGFGAEPPPRVRTTNPQAGAPSRAPSIGRPPVRDTLGPDPDDQAMAREPAPEPDYVRPPATGPVASPAATSPQPAPPSMPSMPAMDEAPPQPMTAESPRIAPSPSAAAPARPRPRAAAGDPRRARIVELQKEIHERLLQYLDLRRMDIDQLADEELWEKTETAICDIVEAMDSESAIPAFVNQDELIKDVLNEALGLGPLEDLLADESVSEIMVNRTDQIYVERHGTLELTDYCFSSEKAILGVIERIVAPLGRRIDESSPLVDARLKDGSRVNAIIPPLALRGPTLTIRKFRRESFTGEQLVEMGTFSPAMLSFLEACVRARCNIVVSGGTGSGKTTTLNVVSNCIPENERIITIEDAAELQLLHEHWVQLESRPPNIEGKGQIAIRDLVRNSLRMRPDRIVVGEVRGGETIDMLQAMNTGHDGSLTTVHSNSPRDTLSRLETMVLMSGMDLPVRAIREQVASAIDIIVHQTRFSDGSRRVTHVTEVSGMESDVITMQDIFLFTQDGFDDNGRVMGRFTATGFVPRFAEDLQRRGVQVDMGLFR